MATEALLNVHGGCHRHPRLRETSSSDFRVKCLITADATRSRFRHSVAVDHLPCRRCPPDFEDAQHTLGGAGQRDGRGKALARQEHGEGRFPLLVGQVDSVAGCGAVMGMRQDVGIALRRFSAALQGLQQQSLPTQLRAHGRGSMENRRMGQTGFLDKNRQSSRQSGPA